MQEERFPPEIGRKTPDQHVYISLFQPTIVFVTICTRNRERWLAQASVQRSLQQVWINAAAWLVGRYILMPDHLHFFCAPNDFEIPIDVWIAYWKRKFSGLELLDTGGWQRSSWHRRLRREESYAEKWDYV